MSQVLTLDLPVNPSRPGQRREQRVLHDVLGAVAVAQLKLRDAQQVAAMDLKLGSEVGGHGGGMRQLSTNVTAVRCVGFAPAVGLQGICPIARDNRARRRFAPAKTRTMGEAMHGSGTPAQVLFGLSPLWVATLLFVGSYLVIMSDRVNRAIVALCGAAAVILVGVFNQDEALAAVDFNTIGLAARHDADRQHHAALRAVLVRHDLVSKEGQGRSVGRDAHDVMAMAGAALLMLLDNVGRSAEQQSQNVHAALSEGEWITLLFFLGLFILVHGVVKVGLIDMAARGLLDVTGGDFRITALVILWSSAILPAFIDNIPFVATMIPLIKAMGPTFGGDAALLPLWWSLALGACLGGNGTLIGASANLVVAGLSERAGVEFRFIPFLKVAFPLMLISIAISHVYLDLRYL